MHINTVKGLNLENIKNEIKWVSRKLTDWLVKITPYNKFNTKNQKKQLLIVKPDAIGDFVLFTGVLPYFRDIYPNQEWEITFLGGKYSKTIAEFVKSDVISSRSVFDSFISIDNAAFRTNLIYRFKFQKKIQQLFFDLVISPVYSRNRNTDQLVHIINSPNKIGIDGEYNSYPIKIKQRNNAKIYTKLIESEKGWLLEIERNASFIQKLGLKTSVDALPKWKIPSEVISDSSKLLKSKGIEGNFAVVCPGASASFRVWSPHKIAAVIDYLWSEYKLPALICGGPKDKNISIEIQKFLKIGKAICLCGETNLIQLSAVMASARLCITMDSGPAHIAIAVNSPLICIIGGGHYKRFFPYGNPNRFRAVTEELDCFYCNWNCKFGQPFCVRDISVETAIKEISELMSIIFNSTSR